ncbi:hypothetical protein BBJ28_00001933 [Nothophytophthora sp. Chile5]|nr:hypothetical protein BBJ28_00001933 [Nothophytophthora sp. Chile5]
MVATAKEEGGVKPKRFGLGGFLPKMPAYIMQKSAKEPAASVLVHSKGEVEEEEEEEPVPDNQELHDELGELPDFPSERRSHDGVMPAPSAAAVAAAALRRRGMSIEQTATSLYRKMSVRQNSAPESQEATAATTSLTGSTDGDSPSPRSDPALKARRGQCVATAFGTGTVLDVRLEDGFYVVQLVPKSVAYLREDAIIREIKSVVGERVKTRWGLATVEQYYVDEDMYSIALDWRWDDEHVWRMKATTKKFEKLHPRGTLIQSTKNRLFEGYSSLRGSTSVGYANVVAKLNTSKSSFATAGKPQETTQQTPLGKALTPFGVCVVLEMRASDQFFVLQTPCGATAYLNADSVRMLRRRTHFADGERVKTPYGLGHVLRFRDADEMYEVQLDAPEIAAQAPMLFLSDLHAETALTHAPATSGRDASARLSTIFSLTRTSVFNASESVRASAASNLPTLSSVKAKVSTMATIKMTPKCKFQKDERVLTLFGSGFVVEARPQDKIYHVYLRRLKFSGYFHEASLSPFPYERVTHFVVDGRTVPAPEMPRNASEVKRRAVITAAIKSAREGKLLDPTPSGKQVSPQQELPMKPIDAMAAAEAAASADAAVAAATATPVPAME